MSLSTELLKSQRKFQAEVRAALECRTKAQKRALYARWLEEYPELHVKELVAVVRDKEAAGKVLAWKLYGE
jgi:hypothetical protein